MSPDVHQNPKGKPVKMTDFSIPEPLLFTICFDKIKSSVSGIPILGKYGFIGEKNLNYP